jgi:hypothetical protein
MTTQIPDEHPSELHAQYADDERRHVVSIREEMDIEPNINADGDILARVVYDTSTGEVVEAKEVGV